MTLATMLSGMAVHAAAGADARAGTERSAAAKRTESAASHLLGKAFGRVAEAEFGAAR